ncbi:MAG: hypothetical protein ACRDMV_09800 [Streptosporangiales bacterium]
MSTRDNGLTAGSYVFAGSITAPIVADLLAELREEGIAAYTVQSDPAERLYVDRVSASYAQVLVRRRATEYEARHAGERTDTAEAAAPSDEEAAWLAIVAAYERPVDDSERPWPAAEDVASAAHGQAADAPATDPEPKPTRTERGYGSAEAEAEEEEEHYVPPPPPRLPAEDMPTKAAFAGIALGLASLCLMLLFDWARQWWIVLLTIAVLAAGVVTHVLRIGDPRNPGSDDGAEV